MVFKLQLLVYVILTAFIVEVKCDDAASASGGEVTKGQQGATQPLVTKENSSAATTINVNGTGGSNTEAPTTAETDMTSPSEETISPINDASSEEPTETETTEGTTDEPETTEDAESTEDDNSSPNVEIPSDREEGKEHKKNSAVCPKAATAVFVILSLYLAEKV